MEKKVIIFGSPVRPLCLTLLTLLSLHPNVIEKGLFESANIRYYLIYKIYYIIPNQLSYLFRTLHMNRKSSKVSTNSENQISEEANFDIATDIVNNENNVKNIEVKLEENLENSDTKIKNVNKNDTNMDINDDFYEINDSQLVNTWSEDSLDGLYLYCNLL